MINELYPQANKFSLEEQSNLYLLFALLFFGEIKKVKNIVDTVDMTSSPSNDDFGNELNELMISLKEVPTRELKILYENLFYIPGPFYVPPYAAEFLYEKNDDISTSQFLNDLAYEYEREGFYSYAKKMSYRMDHLGLMFMYLHFLLEKLIKNEAEDVDETMKKVKNFIHKKMNTWFGEFEKNVSSSLQYGFYLQLVQFIHQFLDCNTR